MPHAQKREDGRKCKYTIKEVLKSCHSSFKKPENNSFKDCSIELYKTPRRMIIDKGEIIIDVWGKTAQKTKENYNKIEKELNSNNHLKEACEQSISILEDYLEGMIIKEYEVTDVIKFIQQALTKAKGGA